MIDLKNKRVLVTGGTGMIGIALVDLLIEKGVHEVTTVSLDKQRKEHKPDYVVTHLYGDLRDRDTCIRICKEKDIIFHLAGIKGSPGMATSKPATFMVPMVQFNAAMLEAIFHSQPEWSLFTSSVGVYAPADVFEEDTVWSTMPSPNDMCPGWAKRLGELQILAYQKEFNYNKISVIRPANVFGPYDNFDTKSCMVIPATINKVLNAIHEVEMHGNGSNVRDFIYARSCAEQMIWMVENEITQPLNAGSGRRNTIKDIVDTVVKLSGKDIKVNWNGKFSGDAVRVMSMKKAFDLGWTPKDDLVSGLKETIDWYRLATPQQLARFDALK